MLQLDRNRHGRGIMFIRDSLVPNVEVSVSNNLELLVYKSTIGSPWTIEKPVLIDTVEY